MSKTGRFDPLIGWSAAALGLAAAGSWAFLARGPTGEASRLGHDVLVTCLLGGAILVSFVSAARILLSSGQLRGIGPAIGVCVSAIAYAVAVFVPSFMTAVVTPPRPAAAPGASGQPSACERVAPLVAEWLRKRDVYDAMTRAEGERPGAELSNRRLDDLRDWRARFGDLELPDRLDGAVDQVDEAVEALIRTWEATADDPDAISPEERRQAQARALDRIRALAASCVE